MRFTRLFIISLSICVLLCSCTAPDTPSQPISSAALLVEISINPEFAIHLEEQGNVLNVEYINADAASVCSGIEYAGVPFDVYLTTVLEKCIQQGYLKDNAEVSVNILVSDTPLSDSLRQIVTQQTQDVLNTVSQAQNLTFSRTVILDGQVVYSEVPETQPLHHQPQYDAQGDLIYYQDLLADGVTVDVYLDFNGNKTKEIFTHPDGTYSVTQYNAQGLQVLFEEYGPGHALITRLTRVYHGNDPLHYTETNLNNESTEYKCDPDGSVIYSRSESDTGELDEIWFENGVIVSEICILPDGVREEVTYQNGERLLENWSTPDGEVWEVHYENGIISKANGSGGDTVWYKLYTNGVETLHRQDSSDGSYTECRYTESGVLYYHATYHAGLGTGSIDTITFNPNGTKAYQITENIDGSTYEVIFDADGKPVTWRQVDANGNVTQGIIDANGNHIDP